MTSIDRNNGPASGRDASGRFAPGNPGRPRGARHKATLAALALLDGEAEALTRKAVEMALAGDGVALRLCLERIAPPRKDAAVEVALPAIRTTADAAAAAARIVDAAAAGEISPAEAQSLMGLIDSFRKVIEVADLAARVEALEAVHAARS